jgi:hypothetical protein
MSQEMVGSTGVNPAVSSFCTVRSLVGVTPGSTMRPAATLKLGCHPWAGLYEVFDDA